MMEVLRQKLKTLAKGEDGVALVVTLAFFMLMYVSCAGVFAIGHAVKEKVIVQNAVDAAAYSAAVVQADCLSRIATINRAMAWTYKDMVSRQTEYVTKKWLEETSKRYDELDPVASRRCNVSGGIDGTVGLNGFCEEMSEVRKRLQDFNEANSDFEDTIIRARTRLEQMNLAVAELALNMTNRMFEAAREALEANLPGDVGDRCLFKIRTPDPDVFLNALAGQPASLSALEERFLRFADIKTGAEEFPDWFPMDNSAGDGFMRSYILKPGFVKSSFVWYDKMGNLQPAVSVDANELRDEFYYGSKASPLVLTKKYFDDGGVSRGAVTVGVAKRNKNAWEGFVDDASVKTGIYAAFTPSDAAKWTWAVSSSMAGYRLRNTGMGYDYYTKWNDSEKDWNLCTDDWDAVFVPVRAAFDSDGFKAFVTESSESAGKWGRLSSSPEIHLDVDEYLADIVKLAAFPRMHNDGAGTVKLDFDAYDFLDLMYH